VNPNDKAGLYAAVWRNTTRDPSWLGYWLARHQQTEDLDERQLAGKLGVTMDNLVVLCLCRTPRDGNLFKEDLQAICQKTGASANVLAQLLRQEENHLRFARAKPGTPGFLAAASDAPGEPSDDPPTA
jgi:hypothetical protein